MLQKQEITSQPGKLRRLLMIVAIVVWMIGMIWIFAIEPNLDPNSQFFIHPIILFFIIGGIWAIVRITKLFDLSIVGDQLHVVGFYRKGIISIDEIESYELGMLNSKLKLKHDSEFGKEIPFYVHMMQYERAEKVLNRALRKTS